MAHRTVGPLGLLLFLLASSDVRVLRARSSIEFQHVPAAVPPDAVPLVSPEQLNGAYSGFGSIPGRRIPHRPNLNDANTSALQPSAPLEELRAKAQARMLQDRDVYTAEEFQAIEALYQSANRNLRAPESRDRLLELVEKYPKANRTGCALLYLAQGAKGAEREAFLKQAIADHSDAWYGDGTQVGAFGRALLAVYYANSKRLDEAMALAAEVERLFPGAVDHSGAPVADTLKRFKLLQ